MNVWGGNVSICMNSQPHSILMMTQDLQLMNMPQPHPLYPTNTRCFSFSFLLFQFCDIIFLVKISPPKNRDINQIYSYINIFIQIFFPNFFVGKMIEFVQNNPPSLTPEDFLVDSGMGMRLLGRV